MTTDEQYKHSLALRGMLHAAGIEGTAIDIPNQYWPSNKGYDDVRTPWLKVWTRHGVILLGWRKRVISIDWSEGTWKAVGSKVVRQLDTTHGERFCHAWSWDDAVKCLCALWRAEVSGG